MYTGAAHRDTDGMVDPTWWSELLSDSRSVVERLLQEEPLPVDALRRRVQAHVALLGRSAGIDTELATALVRGLHGLLDAAASRPALRPVAHVVVRYFETDLEDDTATSFGLDDDAEVFDAACAAAGLDHLLLG